MFDYDDLEEEIAAVGPPEPQPAGEALFDFDELREEPPSTVRIGEVNAIVQKRPADVDRPSIAVVLVPGNPGVDVIGPGMYHAMSPGMVAISEALERAGISTVRYDYTGIGLSAPGGPTQDRSKWVAPPGDLTPWNTREVIYWAREHLSDNVVACCWNYGACDAANQALEGVLAGFVSVSLGYNVYMSYYVMGMRQEGETLKAWYDEFNAGIPCKTLYVAGSMDKAMTPLGHVRRLIKARADGGSGCTLHVIEQKGMNMSNDEYFQLKGSEGEVGRVCAAWIEALREELEGKAEEEARVEARQRKKREQQSQEKVSRVLGA